jgi:hypothetical protein
MREKKRNSQSSEKGFIMKIIQNSPHGTLYTSYNCLSTTESILQIPQKLSPSIDQSHSAQCFGWYEIISLSSSFLTSEREKVSWSKIW